MKIGNIDISENDYTIINGERIFLIKDFDSEENKIEVINKGVSNGKSFDLPLSALLSSKSEQVELAEFIEKHYLFFKI